MTYRRSAGVSGFLDTTHTPVALWKFDGNLLDSSGNGRTLTLVGNELYAYLDRASTVRGFSFDGNGNGATRAIDAALQLSGDMTVEAVVRLAPHIQSETALVMVGAAGETSATNFLWSLYLVRGNQPKYFAEKDGGVDITFSQSKVALPPWETFLLGMVRSGSQVTFYKNGVAVGAASVGLSAPNSGSSAAFAMGGDGGGNYTTSGTVISSLKIVGSALTGPQMLAEAGRVGLS